MVVWGSRQSYTIHPHGSGKSTAGPTNFQQIAGDVPLRVHAPHAVQHGAVGLSMDPHPQIPIGFLGRIGEP